jgi:hypothetical protein
LALPWGPELNQGNGAFSPEECWLVLERAASSTALKRAARLREFLFYVGAKSLKEGRTDIHEQEIGQAVFGRRDSYDTSQDNIVRVSATELRKRVDAYFATEGRDELLIFEIPRGSYTPAFRMRAPEVAVPTFAAAESPSEALPANSSPPPPASSPSRMPLVLLSALAIALAITCGVLWQQNRMLLRHVHPWQSQPALSAFWSHFLNAPQQTDVVLADTSFMLAEELMKQTYPLSDYLNHSYTNQIESLTGCGDPHVLASIVSRNDGSYGDFRVAERILSLDSGANNILLNYARDYTADEIKRNNVILIGSQKSNPWVYLFADQMNFVIHYDRTLDQSFVENRHPRAGELSKYSQPSNPYAALGYSVVAYLPNPSHTANALIIAGTNSEATEAAGDFLTSDASLQTFLNKLGTHLVPYFELLLRTSRVAATPLQSQIVAYRTYQ